MDFKTYPIGVVVDDKLKIVVHGGDLHAVPQVFGQKTLVGHVIMESVIELNIHIVLQGAPYTLLTKERGPSSCI